MEYLKNKIVIGGGIAGLIWAYFHPGCIIISPDFGGQFNSYFPLGPRFLHDTIESRYLLKKLQMRIKPIKIRVGYMVDGKIVDCPPDKIWIKKYFVKSRGEEYKGDTTAMNGGKTSFKALKVDFSELIQRLAKEVCKHCIVIKGYVRKIDTVNKMLIVKPAFGGKSDTNIFFYEELTSTIPLNIFNKVSGKNFDAVGKSITYVYYASTDHNFLRTDADFVYIAGHETLAHRVTIVKREEEKVLCVADWLGEHTAEEIRNEFKDFIDNKIVKNVQIISRSNSPAIDGVKFIGRYGTWMREWKTETVIKEALKDAGVTLNEQF